MNIDTCIDKSIKLIAQYSNSGVIVPEADNADYSLRARTFIDQAQKEVATLSKIHSVYTFTQSPVNPLNGKYSGFEMKQFIPGTTGDLIDISGTNGRSFYAEVDRPCSIFIEESADNGVTWTNISDVSWTDGTTIAASNPIIITTATNYVYRKGLITPSSATNLVRLRFTGTYKFTRRNTALWNFTFASSSDVDSYGDRIEYTVPDDKWMEYNETVHRTDDRIFQKMVDISSVGRKKFYVNYFYTGEFQIHYYIVPDDITDAIDGNTELQVYPGMPQECIPYYVAAHMIMDEYASLATFLLNEYEAKKSNLKTPKPASASTTPFIVGSW